MLTLAILRLALSFAFISVFSHTQASPENPAVTPNLGPGVVVERVSQYGEAETAGIRAGDLLLRWSRKNTKDAKGEIQSPFDLMEIETEQSPRGKVTLE